VKENRIWWGKNGDNEVPALKLFLSDVRDGLIPHNWWTHEDAGHTDAAKKHLDDLFEGSSPFDTPKPVTLMKRIIQISGASGNDIVLDLFAGSAAMFHAVLEFNQEKSTNLRSIAVQLPEPTGIPQWKTVADIAKDRIRRAGKRIASHRADEFDLDGAAEIDIGFKAFRLAKSNFRAWDGTAENTEGLEEQLTLHVDQSTKPAHPMMCCMSCS
jgi:adenine-specific DNA-methyltransferase